MLPLCCQVIVCHGQSRTASKTSAFHCDTGNQINIKDDIVSDARRSTLLVTKHLNDGDHFFLFSNKILCISGNPSRPLSGRGFMSLAGRDCECMGN